MSHAVLSVLMAFLGYSLHNIAQATQKIGLSAMKRSKYRGLSIWTGATVATTISSLIILYAVSLGNVATVGAMAGSGLMSLTLFSRVVMKERIGKAGLAGLSAIILATVLIGITTTESKPPAITVGVLFASLGGLSAVAIILWLVLSRSGRGLGILFGMFAGVLGGFVPVFQKVATSGIGRDHSLVVRFLPPESAAAADPVFTALLRKALELFANPYALTWIALSIISMVILQFAYTKNQVIRVIPAFSAMIVALPVLGGLVLFHESIPGLQWLGILLIFAGVFLLTLKLGGGKRRQGGGDSSDPREREEGGGFS